MVSISHINDTLSRINWEDRRWIIAGFFLIPLPLFIPYLWLDHFYFWSNPDSIFYINVYTSYRDALWQGEIFPHWIASSDVGLGSLVFYNRSPLPYSLTAIISAPFFLSDEHQYLLGIYASQVFGTWAMWRWLRAHYDTRTALLGALLYTLVPYKFNDIYRHFNMAQCWAMAVLPFWFHAVEGIKTRPGVFNYGLAAALCFHAHALTAISVGPLAIAYALHCNRGQSPHILNPLILKPLIMAHLLAFGLVASYLMALVTSAEWFPLQGWSSGNFNSLNNLYHVDDFLGAYSLVLMWLVYRARSSLSAIIKEKSVFFWSIALIVLYIVATPLSYPLWHYIRLMDVFQFPFARLQPGMAIITALLGVCLLARKYKEYTIAVVAVYVLFTLLNLFHIQMVYSRPRDMNMLTHEIAIQHRIIPGPIYLPNWTAITPNMLLLAHEKYAAMPLVVVKDGDATIDATQKGDGWLRIHTHVNSNDATMVVSQFYIPAWQAFDDGQQVTLSPYTDGFIKLLLPEGEHDLQFAIRKSLPERIADAMTLATLAISAFFFMNRLRKQHT